MEGGGVAEVILWFVWGVVGLGKAKEVTPGDTPGGEDPSVPPTEPQDVSPCLSSPPSHPHPFLICLEQASLQ